MLEQHEHLVDTLLQHHLGNLLTSLIWMFGLVDSSHKPALGIP